MADSIFSISVDLPNVEVMPFGRDAMPHLAHAVAEITNTAMQLWQAYAAGLPMANGQTIKNRTGEYLRSIMMRETGDLAAEVYSDLPYAHVIEDGAPARDMKTMLSTSLKVRLTKDGRRYLIIPFRHSLPGAVMGNNMPAAVAKWWVGKDRSHVVNGGNNYKRLSGTGAYDIKTHLPITVAAWRYHWGARLGRSHLAAMGITGKTAQRLEGMVAFRNPHPSAKGSKHGSYITFRVMMEGSKGWLAPAQEGKHPAQQVADQIRPEAEEIFRAALEQDIAQAVGGRVEG